MKRLTIEPLFHRWWGQSVLGLIVSMIVIPSLTHWLELTTLGQGMVIAFFIWIAGMLFQIVQLLRSFHVVLLETKQVLDVINEDDRLLLELQTSFRKIAARPLSGKPNQVFIDYCRRSLEQTMSVAKGAAAGELEVQDHHFHTVDNVLSAFDGCEERVFRCVWMIGHDDPLFDDSWRKYMRCLVELNQNRKANEKVQIRILFVVENDLDDSALMKRISVGTVLGFVSAESGFECRLMSRSDYNSQLDDVGLGGQCLDFGVYGNHLLFRTISYEPKNMGTFSVDPMIIQKYRGVHDVAMDAPSARCLPSDLPQSVSLQQFLDCDKADEASNLLPSRGIEQ